MAQGSHVASEALYVLELGQRVHLFDSSDLIGVGLDPLAGHKETEELPSRDAEHTLLRIEHHVCLAKVVERLIQIINQ